MSEKVTGRPEKPIDWNLVDNLLIAGCHGTEICPYFDMHYSTFYDRVAAKYGMSFTDYAQEKRKKGDSILRAKQFEKATKGDNSMLIWLGKNRLDQKENKDDNTQQQKVVFEVNYNNDSDNKVSISPKTLPDSHTPSPESGD